MHTAQQQRRQFLLVALLGLLGNRAVTAFSSGPALGGSGTTTPSFEALRDKSVLVVGGSGRVGGSCVAQLVQRGCRVTVGGTNPDNFRQAQERWTRLFPTTSDGSQQPSVASVIFRTLDRENVDSVKAVLSEAEFDLVVHTAGPFQGKVQTPNGVLEACVDQQVPYIDVCDDYCTASAAKARFAPKAGAPCIVSTGCWPGVSSLMAKQLVRQVLKEHADLQPQDLRVDFSFFTAGSGGAGTTLLVATFLILAEKALVVVSGRRREVDSMKSYSRINFGDIVGDKDVAHLNLLETASVADVLGVGSVQSLFGTAPGFWNALLGLMAQLPPSLLANEPVMRQLSDFSLPIVRVVDYFAGATNAMRCDVTSPDHKPDLRATAIYAHENLEPCVGECVTAFGAAVLSGTVPPGVWFPEEAIAGGETAAAVLGMASVGAHTNDVQATFSLSQEDIWTSINNEDKIFTKTL